MWINSVSKFQLYKKTINNYSNRIVKLIEKNLNLAVVLNLLPLKILNNEQYLYDILLKHNDIKISLTYLPIIRYDFPYRTERINKILKDSSFKDLCFFSKNSVKFDYNLLNYNKTNDSLTLILEIYSLSKKINIKNIDFKVKKNLEVLGGKTFFVKNDKYSLENLTSSVQITKWGVFLNNCLTNYVHDRKIKVHCIKTKETKEMLVSFCLDKKIINLIGIYKNNKPYACLELVEQDDLINQFYKKNNKNLETTEQHNVLVNIDLILGKELFWSNSQKNYD